MPNWYEDLRNYRHDCGQALLVGFKFNGYQLFPVFQLQPAQAINHCPLCGRRLSLNDCQHRRPTS